VELFTAFSTESQSLMGAFRLLNLEKERFITVLGTRSTMKNTSSKIISTWVISDNSLKNRIGNGTERDKWFKMIPALRETVISLNDFL
jgi:hypothetical protein